jgi:hypothetical protein
LRIVPTNPSQIEHVQFAAVNPPRRMSANTARLHFEMTRPYDGERVVQAGHVTFLEHFANDA